MSSIDVDAGRYVEALSEIVRYGTIRFVRFARSDGLVDGGTIEHLEKLQSSRRELYEYMAERPWAW